MEYVEDIIKEKINIIYKEVLPIVLDGVDAKYHEEVKEGYFKYVSGVYYDLILEDIEENSVDKYIEFYIESQKKNWGEDSVSHKLSRLIDDEYLYKIKKLTGWTLRAAIDRVKTGKILTDREQYVDFFKKSIEYFPKVRSFNQGLARELLGDARLDIEYAYGNSEARSLRCASEAGL